MSTVYDVPADLLINHIAEELKKNDNDRPTEKCVGTRVRVEEVSLTSIRN